MENFGKNQLLKYGWSEGKGLGKNENGMVDALKPKLKFDTAGIGHSESNDYQWWKFIFNKAADNVDIIPNSCDISFKKKDKNVEINTNKSSFNILNRNLLYRNFIKTCRLEEGKLIKNKNSKNATSHTNEMKLNEAPFILDDEKLFKACQGRTAHKGARHGIKQSGKLARIEKQEQELVETIESLKVLDNDWVKVERKREKRRSRDMDKNDNVLISHKVTMQLSNSSELVSHGETKDQIKLVSKKKKRKIKRRIENLTHQLKTTLDLSKVLPDKNKMRKRKSKNKDSESDVEMKEKRKKFKKNNSLDGGVEVNKKNHVLEVNREFSDDDDSKSIMFDNNVTKSNGEKRNKKNISSVNVLNSKIIKKKKQKILKKEKRKINFLSKSLNELMLEKNVQVTSKNIVMQKKKKKNKSTK